MKKRLIQSRISELNKALEERNKVIQQLKQLLKSGNIDHLRWLENAVLEDVEFLKQQLEDLRENIQIRKDIEEETEKKKE